MAQDHFQTAPDPTKGYKDSTIIRKGFRISTVGSPDSDVTVTSQSRLLWEMVFQKVDLGPYKSALNNFEKGADLKKHTHTHKPHQGRPATAAAS